MKYWWIKERKDPQLGTYYIPMGQMSMNDAYKMQKSINMFNTMLNFDSKNEYDKKVEELCK